MSIVDFNPNPLPCEGELREMSPQIILNYIPGSTALGERLVRSFLQLKTREDRGKRCSTTELELLRFTSLFVRPSSLCVCLPKLSHFIGVPSL